MVVEAENEAEAVEKAFEYYIAHKKHKGKNLTKNSVRSYKARSVIWNSLFLPQVFFGCI